MKTGIFVHGLNANEKDWLPRIIGEPPYLLGRASRAVQLLATTYPETELMLFGSGASERGGLKEGDYTIRQLFHHFDSLLRFRAFRDLNAGIFSRKHEQLRRKVQSIAKSELQSHNTITELRYGIPRFVEAGIRRIVLVSDYPHFSRCAAHAGQIIEELQLENQVEIVAEHSFYRHPGQKLSGVKVFEPEPEPKEGIQLGDLAAQLFRVKNRAGFKEEYESLIAKYSV